MVVRPENTEATVLTGLLGEPPSQELGVRPPEVG